MSKKRLIEGDVFSAMTSNNTFTQAVQTLSPATRETAAPKKSTEEGLIDGYTRATIIVEKTIIEKCRDIAYWERLRDQDIYTAALSAYIDQYEKRMGRSVDPRPIHARRGAKSDSKK